MKFNRKEKIEDLAIFSKKPLFNNIRSTSNLVSPNRDSFFSYMKESFAKGDLCDTSIITSRLEEQLSKLHNVKFCISTSNGFWAIALCMIHVALKGKKEVIMPSLTYRRMADIARWVGLTPHFCDIDRENLSIDPRAISRAINDNTALIMAVHPMVKFCDIKGIEKVSKDFGVPLIFDSVEASCSTYRNKPLGSNGIAECFSVHASKFFNGFEGGYVTTNNEDLANKIRESKRCKVINDKLGINAETNEMHSAMLLCAIEDMNEQIERNKIRYQIYKGYIDRIKSIDLVEYDKSEVSSYKNILIKLNDKWPISREKTIEIMHLEKMLVRPYYYPALHQKNQEYTTIKSDLSITEELADQYLLLPCGDFLSKEDIKKIGEFLLLIEKQGKELKLLLKKYSL